MRLIIDELIKKRGIQKKFIAEKLNVDPDTITNWCKNRSFPKLDQAVKLADLLNCDIKDLYTIQANQNSIDND
jgi:DNA-binding XRE family transcriptional regulator